MINLIRCSNEFTKYLENQGYDLFLSINPRHPTSQGAARKKLRRILSRLNSVGKQYYKDILFLYVFYEKNEDRTGVHLHVLLKGVDPERWEELEDVCFRKFGQSKIKATHRNVAKYLLEKDTFKILTYWTPMTINSKYRFRKSQLLSPGVN